MTSALLAQIAARKQQVSRAPVLKPAAGRNRYRVLPSWRVAVKAPAHLSDQPGADGTPSERDQWLATFYADFGQHFLKAPDPQKPGQLKTVAVALCMEKTFGKPCDVCDEVNRGIQNSTDDFQLGLLKEAISGASILLNVLALDTPTPDVPQMLSIAPSVFNGKKGVGGMISLFQDWPKLVALGGPADGCADIIIEKAGAGKEGTTYAVSAVPTSCTLTQAHVDRAKDIDAYIAAESSPQSTQRALTAVSSVSGLLPAARSPALLGNAAAQFAANTPAVASTPLNDVPDFPTTAAAPAPAPAVSTAPVPAPAPAPVAAPAAAPTVAPVQASTPAASPAVAAAPAEAPSLEDLLKDL